MRSRKAKREPERANAPAPGAPQQDEWAGKGGSAENNSYSTNGLSGRGADSVLAHLIEQEKIRGRKQQS